MYRILQKIFAEKVYDITALINEFARAPLIGPQPPVIPSSLLECTAEDVMNVSLIVTEQINKSAKEPIDIDALKQCITKEQFNGEALTQMDAKQFLAAIKKYRIKPGKGRQLFNGIFHYWPQTTNGPPVLKNANTTAASTANDTMKQRPQQSVQSVPDASAAEGQSDVDSFIAQTEALIAVVGVPPPDESIKPSAYRVSYSIYGTKRIQFDASDKETRIQSDEAPSLQRARAYHKARMNIASSPGSPFTSDCVLRGCVLLLFVSCVAALVVAPFVGLYSGNYLGTKWKQYSREDIDMWCNGHYDAFTYQTKYVRQKEIWRSVP
eukprot:110809_1